MTSVLVRKLFRDSLIPVLLVCGFFVFFMTVAGLAVKDLTTNTIPWVSAGANRLGLMFDQVLELMFRGPGKLLQLILGGEGVRFERAMDQLAVIYLHPLIQTILCVWGVVRGAGAIAGEMDKGTMELLMSQPIPRYRVVFAHLLVDLITIPLICLAVWIGTHLGLVIAGPFEISPEDLAKLPEVLRPKTIDPKLLAVNPSAMTPALANLAGLVFASSGLAIAISAVSRFRSTALAISSVVTISMFAANLLGQLWAPLAPLRPLSFFFYYQPHLITLRGSWNVNLAAMWGQGWGEVNVIAVLFGVGLLGYLFAFLAFSRRDLPAPL